MNFGGKPVNWWRLPSLLFSLLVSLLFELLGLSFAGGGGGGALRPPFWAAMGRENAHTKNNIPRTDTNWPKRFIRFQLVYKQIRTPKTSPAQTRETCSISGEQRNAKTDAALSSFAEQPRVAREPVRARQSSLARRNFPGPADPGSCGNQPRWKPAKQAR
jgi:hypothetical protein